jgi:hypothetical protein
MSNRFNKARQILKRPKVCLSPKPIPEAEPVPPCQWQCLQIFPGIYAWSNTANNCDPIGPCSFPLGPCNAAHVGDIEYTTCS